MALSRSSRTRLVKWIASGWILWGLVIACVAVVAPPNGLFAENDRFKPTLSQSPFAAADADYSRSMDTMECLSCHPIDQPNLSHPTDVPAGPNVPDYLPLDNGRVTCTTCHQDTLVAHGQSRQNHDGLLRGGLSGSTFCAQCHIDSTDSSQFHALSLGRAHLNWPTDSANTSVYRAIGDETRQCIGCHDGSVGKDIGASHPVAIPYRKRLMAFRSPTSRRRLTPASRLDQRIRLFDGQVGCGSCHSHYSSLPDHLVMPNDRSQLCRSCHAGY